MTQEDMNNSLQRTLGRIEGKIDGINARLSSGTVRMDKLEVRVSENERRVWRFAGAAGILSGLGVLVIRMLPWSKLLQ